MLRDDATASIKIQLANRTSALIDQWLNAPGSGYALAATTLEAAPIKPWFLLSDATTLTTTATDTRIAFPSDFLQEAEDSVVQYIPSTGDPIDLEKEDYDQLLSYYKNATGMPEMYASFGSYMHIFPIPDATYSVKFFYFKKSTPLSSNIENEWLKYAPLLFMGTAGLNVARGPIRDEVAAKVFESWISTGGRMLDVQNETRMHTNRAYQLGGPH